ncbi:MAG: DUF1688 family protein [Alphaproteobacteria bacterium]|nr:DUF1688 family protein [Alphaproteobacteria bacterium]
MTGIAAYARLLSADAVRERCRIVRRHVAEGRSPHFTLNEGRLAEAADYVAAETRANYPDLKIPPHSRWRHFAAGGADRWAALTQRLGGNATERARIAIDLATVSVLLDAGAGERWRYRETSAGQVHARSEGLAVASLELFAAGGFSSDPKRPLMADTAGLQAVDAEKLARAFQLTPDNPLIGVERRVELLRRLGQTLAARPDLFGQERRPGWLIDHFSASASGSRVPAPLVLETLLQSLAPIWPSGLVADGTSLGDAGRHPAARADDATNGIVPFHKLSQWLTYSLIEPLEMAGLTVAGLDRLTALPEYRNGGLLIDLGVIVPRQPFGAPLAPTSEPVVEWRALTVALMDDLLDPVRQRLGLGAQFALPHLLQGGTWNAGRKIARELRPPGGPPPMPLADDGTVF